MAEFRFPKRINLCNGKEIKLEFVVLFFFGQVFQYLNFFPVLLQLMNKFFYVQVFLFVFHSKEYTHRCCLLIGFAAAMCRFIFLKRSVGAHLQKIHFKHGRKLLKYVQLLDVKFFLGLTFNHGLKLGFGNNFNTQFFCLLALGRPHVISG
jgi:hypothetical protein